MHKVSIIIPVYKDGNVEKIVKKVLEDPYKNKEIIVTADCPSPSLLESLNLIKNYPKVKVKISEQRRGKVQAINSAVREAEGEILIFLDSDLEIRNMNISRIIDACEKFEIVDFVKIVKPKGLLGKMMYVESLIGYVISRIFSHIGRSILLWGAGFAIKKKTWEKASGYSSVVLEDADLATRIYIMGGKYILLDDVEMSVFPPKNFREWVDQRTRWVYGGIEWTARYYKQIIRFFIRYPITLIAYLVLNNPALLVVPISIVLKGSVAEKLIATFLIIISSKYYVLLPVVSLASILFIIKTLVFLTFYLIVTFIVFACVSIFSKKRVNIFWVLLYLFIYSPMYSILMISVTVRYILCKKSIKFNWKV